MAAHRRTCSKSRSYCAATLLLAPLRNNIGSSANSPDPNQSPVAAAADLQVVGPKAEFDGFRNGRLQKPTRPTQNFPRPPDRRRRILPMRPDHQTVPSQESAATTTTNASLRELLSLVADVCG
jgi:hypothetical protein